MKTLQSYLLENGFSYLDLTVALLPDYIIRVDSTLLETGTIGTQMLLDLNHRGYIEKLKKDFSSARLTDKGLDRLNSSRPLKILRR